MTTEPTEREPLSDEALEQAFACFGDYVRSHDHAAAFACCSAHAAADWVPPLLRELKHTRDVLAAHLALESADAAAGSYAGRAEEAEAEVRRLRQRNADLVAAWRQGNARRAGLPCIADNTTSDEAYASATLDLTFDEIRTRVAGYDAATARAEQAEAALAELEKRLGKTDVEWNVRWPDGAIPTTPLDAPNAHMKAALYRSTQLVSRLVGEWQTADMTDGTVATPRTALERAADEQGSTRDQIEGFLTEDGRRKVAEFMAEARQESDDIDPDEVIAQNHADAMRDWGIAEPGADDDVVEGLGEWIATNTEAAVAEYQQRWENADPPLPERQAQLLAGIRKEGGDWSPARARDYLACIGHNVTPERGHQIMKALAGHGLLEQVRPRAYTYRLKSEGGGDE